MKKNWLQIVTLCLCVILLVVTILQNQKLEEYEELLQYHADHLDRELNRVQNICHDIINTLEEANRKIAEQSVELTGIDTENHTLQFKVSLSLKEWNDDTQVTVLATADEKTTSFPMNAAGNGAFYCQIAVPVDTDFFYVDLKADISGGGQNAQECLNYAIDHQLLPLHAAGGGWTGPEFDGKQMRSDFYINIEGAGSNPDKIRNPQFRIYKNGQLAQTLEANWDPTLSMDPCISFKPKTVADGWSIDCASGDAIEVWFRCEDEFGLGYEFRLQIWCVGEESDNYFEYLVKPDMTLFWPE